MAWYPIANEFAPTDSSKRFASRVRPYGACLGAVPQVGAERSEAQRSDVRPWQVLLVGAASVAKDPSPA
ncbi:hypothetical protein TUM18999_35800 [Pseudomonas tohonis]|uniref:Uncharacterized protein n=1 Tax=Pseudomonas tohonis TaxID=2725477 RepID=A0A6J4E7U2_9PSED|nr:hypothetical protein TUM18999_35800 [Pseudomonas tohonis]GJN54781.1 hypothetical protein TUM20286_45330 [Pseudomonas tohonis]